VQAADLGTRCQGVSRLAALVGAEATEALAHLLEEASWYLRDRVVEALGRRPGSGPAIVRVLREGTWYARASACDALGRLGDVDAVAPLVEQLEDRNVSVQKSAVEALGRVARRHGDELVARGVAALPPDRRRRATARMAHQKPAWAAEFVKVLAKLPDDAFAAAAPPVASSPSRDADVDSIVRFRRFLADLPVAGEDS
jgi:HEAT repeat protein